MSFYFSAVARLYIMPLSKVNPVFYSQQLQTKADLITSRFADFDAPALTIFNSPALHYRVRAEFKIWHEGDDSFYAMFNKAAPKQPVRIDTFPIGSELINSLMSKLMSEIRSDSMLRLKLFQVEFLTTLSGESLITMIYHKPLNDDWRRLAEILQQKLDTRIIGRSKKQRMVLSQDCVTETLTVDGRQYLYQQVENSFTQPNAQVNQKMLSWALTSSADLGGDLVELYCGNGNFTAVLAANFDKVLATEISKTSVKSAQHNFEMNGINNVHIARMSAEEFSSALAGDRTFRRLKDVDLSSYTFSTVLVDPPRAGLDTATTQLISRFDNILYISCNPETLYQNVADLNKTHRITKIAIFDQFPYTDHIECGIMLKKRDLMGI
ncbi:tRNA (uracil-5-)-methyltransferase [marine gamma proteobacterium HTCC2143]|jgi:tRNA (uracil-5-)-methyltransferase|uniref:tRNA/tmRNA (uracil-C(5))-methyltransferase n=1 Tax=marine gamma proteobacterium HTCC2143 TaxID=247633 RepID=A0YGS0_9GAMM|nr:tRNA (uracil-5-)-methyltransferase [marine gamma proteobacterium HTCC2143]